MKGLNDITIQADTVGINLVGLTNDGMVHMGCIPWQEVYDHLKYYQFKDKVLNDILEV
jgi:hypothetical protein